MNRVPETAWQLAKSVIWAQRGRLGLGLVLLFVNRAAGFVVPVAPKILFDEVVAKRRTDALVWLALAVVAASIVQGAAMFMLSRVLGMSAEKVVLQWRRRVMARITRLPIAKVDDTQTGALASRVMDDAQSLSTLVGFELARWTSNIVTALVAFVALLWIDWRMTVAAAGFAALPGFGLDFAHRKLRPIFRERSRARSEVQGRLTQTIAGLRVVKAYGAERREQLVFAKGLHRLFRLVWRSTGRRSAMDAVAVVISSGVVAIVVVLGGRAILSGRMTIGDFASYVAFALMFSAPLLDLPEIATRVSEVLADLDRVREIESIEPEDAHDPERSPLGMVKGEVAFERVSFAYRDGAPVLHDVSFEAKAGTTTAIVGASGSGKTTTLSLLMAFYRPTSGRITIDGKDLASVRLRDYRRNLGVVLQDEYLFDGTIAENVAFARPGATRDDVATACRVAHCEEFVSKMEAGLETVVGERGVKLSGGQRQRVAIARAVLADAPLLVLDEATSSLDSESESLVKEALAELRRGRTVFVIAHRLSTVLAADQILVMDRGAIVERGTHEELLARSGRYRALYEAQFGA